MENLDINQEQKAYEYQNGFHLVNEQGIKEITNTITSVVDSVKNGILDPLDAFAVFRELEKKFNEAKKEIDELAISEAEKYDKTFQRGSIQFTRVDGRKTYDFSNIQEWVKAKEHLTKIEAKYKQVANTDFSVLDESTGEILEKPIIKISKSSLAIKNK